MTCLSIFAGCMILGMVAAKVEENAVRDIAPERAVVARYASNIIVVIGLVALGGAIFGF